jgi:hypothetical protein
VKNEVKTAPTFCLKVMDPAHQKCACTHDTVQEFLVSKRMPMLKHPPYSPDLAPCNFFLFPLMKKHVKGMYFDSVEDI